MKKKNLNCCTENLYIQLKIMILKREKVELLKIEIQKLSVVHTISKLKQN